MKRSIVILCSLVLVIVESAHAELTSPSFFLDTHGADRYREWQPIANLAYGGLGDQRFIVEMSSLETDYVAIRVPKLCPVAINPRFVNGLVLGGVHGALFSIHSEAEFSDLIYRVTYRLGARLKRIELLVSGPAGYSVPAPCVLTVMISTSATDRLPIFPESTPVVPPPQVRPRIEVAPAPAQPVVTPERLPLPHSRRAAPPFEIVPAPAGPVPPAPSPAVPPLPRP